MIAKDYEPWTPGKRPTEELSTGDLMLLGNWLQEIARREISELYPEERRMYVITKAAYYAGRAHGMAGAK